jgi:hypothetical protein
MAFKKKSVKVEEVVENETILHSPNYEENKNNKYIAAKELPIKDVKADFEAQLDRLQLNLISTEERRMFTKQEIMAIVESILR